jgi:hypothetical protein
VAKSTETKRVRKAAPAAGRAAERYTHPEQTSPMRPDIGTQAQFRKKNGRILPLWQLDGVLFSL